MVQNHLLHSLSAAYFPISSTGSNIDFLFILLKMFGDDYIFEGLFKTTLKCVDTFWTVQTSSVCSVMLDNC